MVVRKSNAVLTRILRQVCNHPELFERADVKAPLSFSCFNGAINLIKEAELLQVPYSTTSWMEIRAPKLLEQSGLASGSKKETSHLHQLCNIWSVDNLARSCESVLALLVWSLYCFAQLWPTSFQGY